jgi:hypothetical protein
MTDPSPKVSSWGLGSRPVESFLKITGFAITAAIQAHDGQFTCHDAAPEI